MISLAVILSAAKDLFVRRARPKARAQGDISWTQKTRQITTYVPAMHPVLPGHMIRQKLIGQ